MTYPLNRRTLLVSMLASAGAPLFAQEKSSRLLKIIMPFPPGTGLDVTARFLANALSVKLGRPVIVDSKPGGNAVVGTRAAATALPNGDTMLLATNSVMVTNPAVISDLPYQTLVDFVPVARVVGYETVILTHPNSRFKSFAEMVAEGKRPDSKLNFGASTSTYQVAIERIKKAGGFNATVIPYKGTAQALNDLMGGQIDFAMGDLGAVTSLVKAGRLRIVAVNNAKRSPEIPDVPALAEFGIKDVVIHAWIGGFFQSKVDPVLVKQMSDAMLEVMNTPAAAELLKASGGTYFPAGPEEFKAFLIKEMAVTKTAAESANIRME